MKIMFGHGKINSRDAQPSVNSTQLGSRVSLLLARGPVRVSEKGKTWSQSAPLCMNMFRLGMGSTREGGTRR